jgi:kynureninase
MADVRRKSLSLTDLFIRLLDERCAGLDLTLVTPRDHARRGSQVSVQHPHGYPVMQALISRGVIGDYREPGILRFGLAPLYVRHVDVWDAVEQLRDILTTQAWRAPQFQQRLAVT